MWLFEQFKVGSVCLGLERHLFGATAEKDMAKSPTAIAGTPKGNS